MNCTICKLPTGNIVGSVLPQCKCGWQAPQPPATQRTWVGLTDEDRQAAFESMPDMLDGFLKTWGWLHFSKAIEAKLKERNT
jgi:hypothetical protein